MNKALRILTAAAVSGLVAVSCGSRTDSAADSQAQQDAILLKGKADSAFYMAGIQLGAFIKGNNLATEASEVDFERIRKGFEDYMAAGAQYGKDDFEIDPGTLVSVCNDYIALREGLKAERNKLAGEAFLAEMAEDENITKTESGLLYNILEAGSELKPTARDTVWVEYIGTFADGTQFDSSAEASDSARFEMGEVIRGWREGLQLIGEGGRIRLYIPSELGYGDRQADFGILPGSVLVYDITLKAVTAAPKTDEEEAGDPEAAEAGTTK